MSLTDPFSLQIKMTSDWHISPGSGRGEIDSEVQRDADGLPYIPAKTLTGILRDGCEQVALALGETWQQWIDLLFGDQPTLAGDGVEQEPLSAVLSVRSARLDSKLRTALKAKPKLKDAVTFVKPSVAIDSNTGSAKPNYLRFEEVVRMDAVLQSEHCTLNFSGYSDITEDQQKTAFALLVAGTKLIERLGGKRRRGNGNCKIEIVNIKTEEWLQWLQENHSKNIQPPTWEKPKELKSNGEAIATDTTDTTWYAVPLTITILTPIVLPKRTVGNVVECLDYIPGRYFLGHLHRVLGEYIDVSRAIGCGDLVITNATIEIGGIAGRPTPFCLFGKKLDGGMSKGQDVYNRFVEAEPKDQIKGERSGYVGQFVGTELPEHKTVKLQVNTHNTIDDKKQRPSPETGGAVYSYQAIPPDTSFKAELRLPKSIKDHLVSQSSKDWWKSLHCCDLRIGQSKKDQYGLISVAAKKPKQYKQSEQTKLDKHLFVWFLSDVLLRDERLNPTTDPDVFREVLATELGVTLEERQDSELLSLMMKPRRTESWQVRWGLPRPSMLGWQAGSCVVYKVEGEIKQEKLAELEARGIGDRRAEGYGQICFNDPLLMAELSNKTRQSSASKQPEGEFTPILQSDPCFAYARTIEIAAWREAIANQAAILAANSQKRKDILGIKITPGNGEDKDKQPKSQPPMSQLGGLRSVFLKLQSSADVEKVTSWLDALEGVPNRKQKWEQTQNGLGKISALVKDDSLIWSHLDLALDDLAITHNGITSLKQELWAEAVRTLIDAMIRGQKRALEDAEKKAKKSTQGKEAS